MSVCSLLGALALSAGGCGDEGSGDGGAAAEECEPGFVRVGGVCREAQDTNNTEPANNSVPVNNNSFEPAPYTCEPPTGDYTPPQGDGCDLVAQGCEGGAACMLTAEGAACLPAGEAGCGEPCASANSCAAGLLCAGEPRRCLAICVPGEACPGDSLCAPLAGREDVGVCTWPEAPRWCDVFAADCEQGEGCYLVGERLQCGAAPEEPAGEGEGCEFANSCAPGLLCAGSAAAPVCALPCRTDGSEPCAAGLCTPLRGFERLGVCLE